MRRRINGRPWKRPPWRRRSGRSGQWLNPSATSSSSLDGHSPWADPVTVTYPGVASAGTPGDDVYTIGDYWVLSSAVNDDLLAQPVWPKHTVQHIVGDIFTYPVCRTDVGNNAVPGGPFYLHLGMRKFRFDDISGSPRFSVDATPGAPDDADDRWIWRKHIFVPPALPFTTAYGDGSGASVTRNDAGIDSMSRHPTLSVNIKNPIFIDQDEGLLLVASCSSIIPPGSTFNPWGELLGLIGHVMVQPYLRSYVVSHK